ncbi:hypothetical protein ACOCJ4_16360 [Knoellia sp. CPCC 206435]|uniref:hypothetical protein n=1 Tax=Knoellia terrae TaxID=3404797 RepID=UPI003B428FEC
MSEYSEVRIPAPGPPSAPEPEPQESDVPESGGSQESASSDLSAPDPGAPDSGAPETGDLVIDASLRDLASAPEDDLDAQIERGEQVQRTLQGRLGNLGG